MPEEIRFVISTNGEVVIKVDGFAGKTCLEATRPYEDALGIVNKRNYKINVIKGMIFSEQDLESGVAGVAEVEKFNKA